MSEKRGECRRGERCKPDRAGAERLAGLELDVTVLVISQGSHQDLADADSGCVTGLARIHGPVSASPETCLVGSGACQSVAPTKEAKLPTRLQ